MTQEPSKRIVSTEEFIVNVLKKTILSIGSLGLGLITGLLFVLTFSTAVMIFAEFFFDEEIEGLCFLVIPTVLYCFGLVILFTTKLSIKQTRELQVGIPLTCVNTANLPAPESLVRASSEPIHEQQTVLLRAATETTEHQTESLLRASIGEQK